MDSRALRAPFGRHQRPHAEKSDSPLGHPCAAAPKHAPPRQKGGDNGFLRVGLSTCRPGSAHTHARQNRRASTSEHREARLTSSGCTSSSSIARNSVGSRCPSRSTSFSSKSSVCSGAIVRDCPRGPVGEQRPGTPSYGRKCRAEWGGRTWMAIMSSSVWPSTPSAAPPGASSCPVAATCIPSSSSSSVADSHALRMVPGMRARFLCWYTDSKMCIDKEEGRRGDVESHHKNR